MAKTRILPGYGPVAETDTKTRILPGYGPVAETAAAVPPAGTNRLLLLNPPGLDGGLGGGLSL